MSTVYFNERPRKKGKSYPTYYIDPIKNEKCYYKTFHSRPEAVSECARLRVMIESQEYHKLKEKTQKKEFRPLKFIQVAEMCKKTWQDRLKKRDISPVTVEGYLVQLKQINKDFGKKFVFDFTEEDIEAYRTKIADKKSNASSNRRLFVIKQVFERAYKEKAIYSNPASNLQYLTEKMHCRNEYLVPSELKQLLKACEKTRAKFYLPAIIFLAAEHGAAKQEILDLRWKDINFDQNTIYFDRTKNGVKRTMYMMPRTQESLLAWRDHVIMARKKRKLENVPDEFVFCHLTTGKAFTEFKSSWERVKKIAKIKNFHFHDLRHTYASNILTSGGGMKDVMEMIGHKDIRSTLRYTHLNALRKASVQERLANHYNAG